MKSTTTVLKGNQVNRSWHLIDLDNQMIGRAATQIAQLLMGKQKITFSYHRDDGDFVIAINASRIQASGKKLSDKLYQTYSGFPGGLKELTLAEMMKKDPRKVILNAVKGMLPKNKLRDRRLTRLKVFVGSDHPFAEKLKSAK
ncbi:50S ribosomal protein L13 [Candidatus Shapirobacteria bacterium RBG_13_44_7]|uniref:Large ribosomal subunit protein uL13 n=1 Tax=Candidatus Shapirobacteria bacterium RBG_13_44_7 TaxID=1802149 RepID=A0A1F7SK22_9BACT|nr:MAG: 50S ribosomal protein L13 [Candidatus Shapirobacteria bacterium RBG_13_44_7]